MAMSLANLTISDSGKQPRIWLNALQASTKLVPMQILVLRNQSLAVNCGDAWLSLPANSPVLGRCETFVAGNRSSGIVQRDRQTGRLWLEYRNPEDLQDNRIGNGTSRKSPSRHTTSKEPAWENSQLAMWNSSMSGPHWSASTLTPGDDGKDTRSDGDSQVISLHRRMEKGELRDAVEALELMVLQGYQIKESLFYHVLKRCMGGKDLVFGMRVHALAVKCGLESNAFLANHMICMYASHGRLDEATKVFAQVVAPDCYMWASMILAHARHGQPNLAILLYRQMRGSTVQANNHVYVAVLKACTCASDLTAGKEVHADIMKSENEPNLFVCSCLVDMYAKCGILEDARKVFDQFPTRDVVMWNALIAGYAQQGYAYEALALFGNMQQEGITSANHVTFACLLQACASVGALQQGKELHTQIQERGLEANLVVGNSLVDMYAKCGRLEDARTIFERLPTRSVVTWNAMIAGYAQHGLGQEALAIYAKMQDSGMTPADHVTYVCLLQACASIGALHQGKELHGQIQQRGLEVDVAIGNCLVNMYSKCGCLEDARRVFDRLPMRNVVTWTVLLNGYAEHSDGRMAIQCFKEMLHQGVEPDDTTFRCLLVACSHAGLVHEGQQYFKLMVEDHGIVPSDYHYNCMVDLLGRSGHLNEAENLLQTMPFENHIVGWTSLLTACKSHGDVERGRRCFNHLRKLEPENSAAYVLFSNIYANAGRWKDVYRIEGLRKSAGAKKKPAKACIEVKHKVHEFTVGEDRNDISSKLRSVNLRLKQEGGHVPHKELVLKAVSEHDKEDALCGHAEKLALAYGLLNTPDGTTLLVTKNLRMCNDCHSSTKIMSQLEQREIIVRDAHRVHRFLAGACSCGDRH